MGKFSTSELSVKNLTGVEKHPPVPLGLRGMRLVNTKFLHCEAGRSWRRTIIREWAFISSFTVSHIYDFLIIITKKLLSWSTLIIS